MVVHQVDLQTGIGRVTAFGIAADQFTQRTQRLFSDLLVAGNVSNLLVIAKRDQIISVGRILVARMDRQETLRRLDRLRVVAAHIIAERAHQLRPARSEEHTSELQSLMRISYAVFCLKKKKTR